MRFNVAQLLQQPIGETERYPILDSPGGGGGKVELMRTNRSILVTGHLEVSIRGQCVRCLEEFDQPLALDFQEEFFPVLDIATGQPLPPAEEPGAFTIDENHELDLGEAVRQYTLLAVPMKPVCRPDCRGLCPRCGANLNLGPCGCPPSTDPRWAKLREITLK